MIEPTEDAPRILPYGDSAFLVEFGNRVDRAVSERILALNAELLAAGLPGLTETLPACGSLLVRYDPLETGFARLSGQVKAMLTLSRAETRDARLWRVPVCHDGDCAQDLADVAEAVGLSPARVLDLHLGVTYHVYMIGFVPGLPYLGDLPEALSLPRRKDPRLRVPPGSIAIALTMVVLYPVVSPGGWHLIGQTPLKIFDAGWSPPALFAPGDKIVFEPIGLAAFHELRDAVEHDGYRIEARALAE